MSIQTRSWNIEFDKTPGAEGLRISGLVSVPEGAYGAALGQTSDEASIDLHLEILLPLASGIAPPAPLIDKSVSFFAPGHSKYNSISVYHKGELILSSTGWLMKC